jgi:hypothetical protein
MTKQSFTLVRSGISLVEILIGIMVLGIGVISLATLFPIGLLKMKRAVNDVRGTVVSRSALSEVRIRNLLAQPYGPPATYFSAYPAPAWTATRPVSGLGMPVIIDPLWMIQAQPAAYTDRFGFVDYNGDNVADFTMGEGLLRVRGGSVTGTFPLELASEIFSSPDDLAFGDNESRVLPLQFENPTPPPAPQLQYLRPTYGTPFALSTLSRERRYTWMILARKVNAGQIFHPGLDGLSGTADDIVENNGPDLIANPPTPLNPVADDPALDLLTGNPQPAPVGPFDVTIVAFYSRDFGSREAVFATNNPAVPPAAGSEIFVQGRELATLRKRTDNVPFPDIPLNSYVMDTTLDSAGQLRNGFVYRVISRTINVNGDLDLILDQRARADGYVLTVLKGAVAVFEKQVP